MQPVNNENDRESGGALAFNYFDFAQSARVHVENEAVHGDGFGNPGVETVFRLPLADAPPILNESGFDLRERIERIEHGKSEA